jgi:glycosyltransferase involved in cell wall biosynthesis
MLGETAIENISYFEKGSLPECDVIFFANVSQNNHIIGERLKAKGVKIIYLYHEPLDRVKNYLKEGFKQTIKALGAHYLSVKLLKLSDLVIVPSNYALKLYSRHDVRYCKNVEVIPLLFDDECTELSLKNKEFFSYIGHAVKGHAFERFLEFVQYCYKSNNGLKFQIATRTDLTPFFKKYSLLSEMINEGMLKVTHGRPLTNEEINQAYREAFCIWSIYNRSTQSGVLPKAFMFGTPVLANRIGSFPEFVQENYNGLFIDEIDFGKIERKAVYIKEKIAMFSKNARETFLKTFYYKEHLRTLSDFMNRYGIIKKK